jgi:hypothetical protein
MRPQLTIENLLKAVAIVPEEVESWCQGDISHPGLNGSNPDLKNPLPPPEQVAPLEIHVRLKPPPEAVARKDSEAAEISELQWQDLEARWKAILVLESTIETFRISLNGLLTEMETALKRTLSIEEKTYALRADVAQWERAKHRIHFALPKMRDFVHRSTWALGLPERKRLEELYKDHIRPQLPFRHLDEVLKQLEDLQKNRQVLAAHGKTVHQESKAIAAEIQGTVRTLQNNAANAHRKKDAADAKGRFLK